ncbi:cytochrome P450 [Paraphoma chrysanthemicola]|nr:cytochrome P450 [Paraphoma chrysanthemicola]
MLEALSKSRIVILFLGAILFRWLARGVYRVYFHPLHGFPGPKASAFTRLPHLNAIRRGKVHIYVAQLHEQYGEVVRISPDELSFLNPRVWRDIYAYGAKDGEGSAPPKHFHRYARNLNNTPALTTIRDPIEHARTRKIFTSAFSDRALTQQSPLFTTYADKLVRNLKQEGVVDLVSSFNYATFDAMADLTFGESLHMLDNSEYNPWVKIMFEQIKIGVKLSLVYYYYPIVAGLLRKLLHKVIAKAQYTHFNFSRERVEKRMEKGRSSEGVDLWDLILQHEEKGKAAMSSAEMIVNANLFMVAGTETTATLLSGLTYLLLTHPDKMTKLVDEIRGQFASSDEITMEATQSLPYLNACIKEGLRRYPPVPVGLPHLTPADGSTVCGYYVPPGCTVGASHYAMYRSPRLFKDPLSFVPERWTGDERYANDERSAVQPFSYGARDCLGKNMAYHEMRLLLSKVIYNFDLELLPEMEEKNWLDQRVFTLWEKSPMKVKVKSVDSI